MSDPLAKIKKKLQDEIDQLSHELSVELPKRLPSLARTATSRKTRVQIRQGAPGLRQPQDHPSQKRMGDLSMLNLTNIPKDRSGYGSRLTVLDLQRDKKIEYTLVSSEEADAEKGLISTTSPIGKALLNRRVGDEIEVVTPRARKSLNSSVWSPFTTASNLWLFQASYSTNRVGPPVGTYELGNRPGTRALDRFRLSSTHGWWRAHVAQPAAISSCGFRMSFPFSAAISPATRLPARSTPSADSHVSRPSPSLSCARSRDSRDAASTAPPSFSSSGSCSSSWISLSDDFSISASTPAPTLSRGISPLSLFFPERISVPFSFFSAILWS